MDYAENHTGRLGCGDGQAQTAFDRLIGSGGGRCESNKHKNKCMAFEKKKSMVSNYSKRFEKEVHSCIKPYNKESDV